MCSGKNSTCWLSWHLLFYLPAIIRQPTKHNSKHTVKNLGHVEHILTIVGFYIHLGWILSEWVLPCNSLSFSNHQCLWNLETYGISFVVGAVSHGIFPAMSHQSWLLWNLERLHACRHKIAQKIMGSIHHVIKQSLGETYRHKLLLSAA